MEKFNGRLAEAFRSAARRLREVRRRGRESGDSSSSSFFYTANFPGGVYMTGFLTDKEIESKKR